ncbi:MAG: class I SAM-dependent methyltransferase [Thermoleophilia bacterium]
MPDDAARPRTIRPGSDEARAIADAFRATYLADAPAEWLASPEAEPELEHEVVTRHADCVRFTLPWLASAGLGRVGTLVEVGCGTGAKTAALATIADRVLACEPSEPHLAAARARLELMDVRNVELATSPAGRFLRDVAARCPDGVDAVVLYAVLEHMTLDERDEALGLAWGLLRDGGALVVQETPNRLLPLDAHTSDLPFFGYLPDGLAVRYADRSPRRWFREGIAAAGDAEAALYRSGRGLSQHEFELALGRGFADAIVADGWSVHLLNRDEVHEDEFHLREWAARRGLALPPAFSRYWIALVARKGANGELRPPAAPAVVAARGGGLDLRSGEILLDAGGTLELELAPAPVARELVVAADRDLAVPVAVEVDGDALLVVDAAALGRVEAAEWCGSRALAAPFPAGASRLVLSVPAGRSGRARLPYLHVR